MNLVFIDSEGQVEAMQSTPMEPAPTSWETEKGYTRLEVTDK